MNRATNEEAYGIDCPNCGNFVEPVRRKILNSTRDDRISAGFAVAFGDFCPMDGCGHRFDNKPSQRDEVPTDEPEAAPVRSVPKKVVPIRPVKDSEDLFSRIRREHEEAVREERELADRLGAVIEKREKLDRLIVALAGISASIPVEESSK
jgi:hypothetical protein